MSKSIIAITMGDPGGVGPEIIVQTLRDLQPSESCSYLVIGARQAFDCVKAKLHLELPFHSAVINPSYYLLLKQDAVNFLDINAEAHALLGRGNQRLETLNANPVKPLAFEIGKVSRTNAALAYAALEMATKLALRGLADAIVTAPIHKAAMRLIDPKFQGHTEYLAGASKTKTFAMMFVSPRLKLTLVTIHVPVKKIAKLITAGLVFEKISLTHQFLQNRLKIASPKIAVCALNPHGSETGDEELSVIRPAVKKAQRHRMDVTGPFSADQLFYDAYEGRYDALISMYHDQGLGPFKMIAFHEGVNVTLGLPFVRTSPDHGTAFGIAYQGKAAPSSMREALALAKKLAAP
ncbi:MAG: 4-hydroxythreonine-4-phosphate dehydrogenase PdxA [Candidatus Omnitrophica bacterium]|nr:4-hydroxythreonine-4-phosphate dehydrogenase PdxA [Candidatus Omnitrophota bacterium]MDD5671553.1 4-hydroxythreonine-4-phosphate dehydrogenase PdxA [Candidatus Omnitrophota bacterium]